MTASRSRSEDVIWSFDTLKKISPDFISYFGNVKQAVKVNDREVKFEFDQGGNRELPMIMGDLVVLPKHWWEGTNAKGEKRDITRPTLEAPLGSGAYRIESFKPGTDITWTRVEDYWASDLPINVGRNNFDRRRYRYVLDQTAEWQAFIKGGYEDLRAEN
jgi:microcin C transport system substrate-binding protein